MSEDVEVLSKDDGLDMEMLERALAPFEYDSFNGGYRIKGVKDNRLTLADIPYGVTVIGVGAFYGCKNLARVTLPESLTAICKNAFYDTAIRELVIPRSVKRLENYSLFFMNKLESITLPFIGGNDSSDFSPHFGYIFGTQTDGCNGSFDWFNTEGRGGKVYFNVPDTLTRVAFHPTLSEIGRGVFSGCDTVKELALPSSLCMINGSVLCGLTSLERITVEGENGLYSSRDGLLYDSSGRIMIHYPAKKKQQNVTLPDGTEAVGNWSFCAQKDLRSLILPDGVRRIGEYALSDCKQLYAVILPDSIEYIAANAFSYSYNAHILYRGTKKQWKRVKVEKQGNEHLNKNGIEFEYKGKLP